MPKAITSLERMCNATDFKIEMLSAAANLCHQRGDKDILVEVLRLLLNEYIDGKDIPDTEILIVLSSQAIQTVCGYLDTTICILRKLSEKQSSPGQVFATARGTLFKELEWFAQTAWNIGLQSCENWKNGVLTNRFLGITFKLLDMIVPETIDIIHRKKLCLFISIASRMLENHDRDAEAMRIILEDIEKFKKLRSTTIEAMVEISPSNDAYQPTAANSAKMSAVSDPTNELMLLFEFEATVLLQQYETAVNAIKISFSRNPIAQAQLVLEAILSRERIDFIRYARWMRVLLTSALVRNKSAALPYYAQVIDCLSEMAKVRRLIASRSYILLGPVSTRRDSLFDGYGMERRN
ncbi:hypothetical protein BC937DRAFT_94121 [Endogone sp. FLAS-F59071]|nr:hypothetical protein BC937DRAFT_94121 [Endogone sp. FLAS-F59071]|eukprot:RUS23001.1 hypothetical protein BC937DRAFT_94121 [Endogone sp. FLAS-F59071]